MITLRKLAGLPDGTRQRKHLVLIRDFEKQIASGNSVDTIYLSGLLRQISEDDEWTNDIGAAASAILMDKLSETFNLRRPLNELGHAMAVSLGREWADWDAAMPGDSPIVAGLPLFPFRVYLDGLRSPFNVGSVMRTAMAYGVEQIWVSGDCSSPSHRRAVRSSMGAVDRLPWETGNLEKLEQERTGRIFALELGGTEVNSFDFPVNGTVILGSEELGIRPELLDLAEKSAGIVSLPLPGAKASLNVGVAFGILMEHWVRQIS